MRDIWLGLLKAVASLTPIFTGFLYYIGRGFTEAYYETLGVPHAALRFSVPDYLFKSVQSWVFLIAIGLTYLVFILWQTVFKKPESMLEIPSRVIKKKSKSEALVNIARIIFRQKKGDPQLLMLFWLFFGIFWLVLVILWTFPKTETGLLAQAFTETIMLVFVIGSAWMIMIDQPTMKFIRDKKTVRRVFIGCVIFVVVISMQLLPYAIGRLAGIYQTNPYRIERYFPNINIVANKPLWSQDIEWVEQDGMYEAQDRLILILQNSDGLFVKKIIQKELSEVFTIKKISETYYMPNGNVEGLSINYTG